MKKVLFVSLLGIFSSFVVYADSVSPEALRLSQGLGVQVPDSCLIEDVSITSLSARRQAHDVCSQFGDKAFEVLMSKVKDANGDQTMSQNQAQDYFQIITRLRSAYL